MEKTDVLGTRTPLKIEIEALYLHYVCNCSGRDWEQYRAAEVTSNTTVSTALL